MTLTREAIERIQLLAEDPAMDVLIELVKERCLEEWRTSPPDAHARREHLYRMFQVCDEIRQEVRNVATSEAVSSFNKALQSRQKWGIIG